MDVEKTLRMNAGETENSYANNSVLQKTMILGSKPIIEEAIREFVLSRISPTCFKIADLGCSSGPNALFLISNLIDIVRRICQEETTKIPEEFQVFLNDLPGNDFNSIFKSIPSLFPDNDKSLCFISGVPGSFYGQLFPSKSLHFVHSSSSVHWLSKVPSGLVNKGSIYIVETSLPEVFEAYLEQFRKDFSLFLSLRSKEMTPGGRMIITLVGRSELNPTSRNYCYFWDMLSKSLRELADEGIIKEDDIDSFNVPLFSPHEGEVRGIIEMEGSFTIGKLEFSEITKKNLGLDENNIGKHYARHTRAWLEPLLTSHFGDHIIDPLFSKFAKYMSNKFVLEHLTATSIVISLINK